MELEVKNNELQLIYNEYRPYFKSIDLKLATSVLANLKDGVFGNRTSHIRLQTGEGDIKRISVDLNGWYVIGHDNRSYETFELLMMDVSQHFRTLFGDKLTEKLQILRDDGNRSTQ